MQIPWNMTRSIDGDEMCRPKDAINMNYGLKPLPAHLRIELWLHPPHTRNIAALVSKFFKPLDQGSFVKLALVLQRYKAQDLCNL